MSRIEELERWLSSEERETPYTNAEGEQILLGTKPLNFVETMEMVKEGRIKDLLYTLQETSYSTSGTQANHPKKPAPLG